MKPEKQTTNYDAPEIKIIRIDQEIALVLESPPPGPGEGMLSPEYEKNNPLQDQLV